MKKSITALLCLVSLATAARKIAASAVPSSLQATFAKSFPTANSAKWEKEKDGGYEVAFMEGDQKLTATYDAAGVWKETEKTIAVVSLPATVTKYVHEHSKGAKIKEAAELKMADGSTHYEAQVKGVDMIFDGDGNYLKSAME